MNCWAISIYRRKMAESGPLCRNIVMRIISFVVFSVLAFTVVDMSLFSSSAGVSPRQQGRRSLVSGSHRTPNCTQTKQRLCQAFSTEQCRKTTAAGPGRSCVTEPPVERLSGPVGAALPVLPGPLQRHGKVLRTLG